MAEATEKQADWAKLQGIFAAAAVVGLIWTLWYTRQSTKAAIDAVTVAIDTSKKELRAYMNIGECNLKYVKKQPVAEIWATNCGQTPATNVKMVGTIHIISRPTNFVLINQDHTLSKGRVGRDKSIVLDAYKKTRVTAEERDGLEGGTHILVVHGVVEYTDIFDDTWVLPYEFCTGGIYGKPIRRGILPISAKGLSERKKDNK